MNQTIKDQLRWMDECGGDLAGYLDTYGERGKAIYAADQAHLAKLRAEKS